MDLLGFLGPFLLGTGPLLAVFLLVIARQPFLIVSTLITSFYWLTVLSIISITLRALTPTDPAAWAAALLLTAAVTLEEFFRAPLLLVYWKVTAVLRNYARHQNLAYGRKDEWTVGLSLGVSQAAVHSGIFFVGWLPAARQGATLYLGSCWGLSFFVQSALRSLAFSLVLPAAMIIAVARLLECDSPRWRVVLAPSAAIHWAAAMLTVLGSVDSVLCRLALPCLLVLGLGSCAKAVRLALGPAASRRSDPAVEAPTS